MELTEKIYEEQTENFKILENVLKEKVFEKFDNVEEKNKKNTEELAFFKETMDHCNEKFVEKFNCQLYPNMFCEKCKKKLRLVDIEQLKTHMESVHRVFKCLECEFISESERGRNIHIKKNHGKS